MKLKDLIKNVEVIKTIGKLDIEINELVINSKLAVNNSLYFALNGYQVDGNNYIFQAEKYGAKAVVTEKECETNLTQIIVKDCRVAMSIISAKFYNNPQNNLRLIGIVGTNGKTTTAYLIHEIFNNSNVKCGFIGTIGVFYDNKSIESSLTTPDPIELYKTLKNMVDCGVQVVVMEVSAHAIYLKKVYGLEFECGIFTNFSLDHLDFFKDLESYKKAKLSFFSDNKCKYIISNLDDDIGKEIAQKNGNVITYGLENPSDIFAIDIKNSKNGIAFIMNLFDMVFNVNLSLVGKFNVYNTLCACTCASLMGIKAENIVKSVENIKCVSGRLEKVFDGEYTIYVDFAHTPDGLEKSLSTLRNIVDGRIICVFGCGGNRDKSKRQVMGKISGDMADFTIITSDNPRFEEPMEIISEIEKGAIFSKGKYLIIEDREQAIDYAINYATKGDTILIAGKGAEKYQDILGIKRLYNDKDIVKEIIGRRN